MLPLPPLFGELLVKTGRVTALQLEEALALQQLTGQRVGESLVSLGHVTPEALRDALLNALGLPERGALERPLLGDILVRLKHVTVAQRDLALERLRLDGQRLGEILVEQGACTFKEIHEALGLQQARETVSEADLDPPPGPHLSRG